MARPVRLESVLFLFMVMATSAYSGPVRADIGGLGSDGWYTWEVEAAKDAPEMCCFSWRNGTSTRRQCDLDSRDGGFNSSAAANTSAGNAQIYALMEAGAVTRIRAFSSGCPVVADTEIIDLGRMRTDDSVQWLGPLIGGDASANSIAAIAIHNGPAARDALLDAAKPDNAKEVREEAIFWMAQARIGETGADIKRYLFADENADIREHAAFSYSQSNATDVASTLIRQGRDDHNPDVRSQAWFWLAQTEADESEAAIENALLNDKSEDVREEAVFALSLNCQLDVRSMRWPGLWQTTLSA